MNENDRFVLISIENPKLDIGLSIRFSSLGVTGEEISETRWGGWKRERGTRERRFSLRCLPSLLTFAAVFWMSRNVGASVGYLFAALFICLFPLSPRNV